MFANSNAACMFCTRFERIIHSISTDLAGHKHLFFFPCTMQFKVLISQNVVLVSKSKRRVCVLRTCLDLRLNEKEKKKEGGISTFTLLNYEIICGFAQVQVSFHH